MRCVAIADSDSYLTWASAFMGALSVVTERELILVETPVLPSETQRAAALAVGRIDPEQLQRVPLDGVRATIRREQPDAVLIALRGPVAAAMIRMITELPERPVIVTGLPGISFPATRKALAFRRQADLFVLHSRREIREFTRMSREYGWTHRFALGTLPFTGERTGAHGGDLVFAAQALTPRAREERERLMGLLVAAARADPTRRVVIKVRTTAGDGHDQDEEASFRELVEEARAVVAVPRNLVVSTAPLSAALDAAHGLVTVSSTASIEAISRGIPVIALDSFGISDELLNTVFEGSGLFGDDEAVIRREFRHPEPAWLEDNYFHSADAEDVAVQLQALVAARRQGVLAAREPARRTAGPFRPAGDPRGNFGDGHLVRAGAVRAVSQVLSSRSH